MHRRTSVAVLLLLSCAIRLGAVAARAQAPDPAMLKQHAEEGERALAEGRYREAEQAYETLRRLSPGTAEVHARLGLIYFQQGKFSEAVSALREAGKLKPDLPKVDTLLAMSLSELGRYEEALPGLAKGFADSQDPVLRRLAGLHLQRAYTGLQKDLEAVEVALALTRLHPDDPEVLYHSGRLFANFAYLQTIRLSTVAADSVWMHQAAGEANESQGLYDDAISEYRQVLARAPARPGIHFRIGRALLAKARAQAPAEDLVADALKAFHEELRIDATNANAAYEIGELHRRAGRLDEARAFFERAIAHHPDFESARVGLARALVGLGLPALALPHLQAATARNPGSHVAHYQLAQVYGALGRTAEQEQALATFTRLREAAARRSSVMPETRADVTPQEIEDRQTP